MSGNLFGNAFRVMTFGESHGPYIGLVIDGVKPGLPVDSSLIQKELDRRRPGQSTITTPRQEADRVEIISGVFENKTTGTPICMLIGNHDQHSQDYNTLKDILRPGHAAYTFLMKYGIFDYRGGGRASGRETAARVAAGAVARQFLEQRGIKIFAYTRQIADIEIENVDFPEIEKNPVRAADPAAAVKMMAAIEKARDEGDSLGGVVEIVVKNCQAGLGEPVFNKLDAELAAALMSIGAVKAFEMGSGFSAARMKGSEHNDPYYFDENQSEFRTATNHAGGVLGGISNGEDLVMRITVKPPSSIAKMQKTVNRSGQPIDLSIAGRHDPCICPRVVPVAEAMVGLVLLDHILMQERISRDEDLNVLRKKIDTIDTELILLLAQRQRLAEKIGEFKQQNGVAVKDHRREEEIFDRWEKLAGEVDLPAGFSGAILKLILAHSEKTQQDRVK